MTSRFAPFVMRDEDGDDDLLFSDNWLNRRDRVILAVRDNRLEDVHFDELFQELDASLAATGYYTLTQMRQLAPDIRNVPFGRLEPLLEDLRVLGDLDLVETVLEAFRSAPPVHRMPGPVEHKKAAKAAALQALAKGEGPEAEAAAKAAAEIAQKHKVTPRKSKWSLDLEEISEEPAFERVITPIDTLIQKLDGALKRLKPLHEQLLTFRYRGRDILAERERKLIELLEDPHGLRARKQPDVVYRHRRS
jgi:hypothetical protein